MSRGGRRHISDALRRVLSSFLSFVNSEMVQVAEIHPHGRKGPIYPVQSMHLRALKYSTLYKKHIFQCIGKMICVEFQRYHLKFHTKYLTPTLKDVLFLEK